MNAAIRYEPRPIADDIRARRLETIADVRQGSRSISFLRGADGRLVVAILGLDQAGEIATVGSVFRVTKESLDDLDAAVRLVRIKAGEVAL